MANRVDPEQTAPICSLFWVHAVCFSTEFVSNARQLFAADDFNRRHFQMHFFLGTLRVNFLILCMLGNLCPPRIFFKSIFLKKSLFGISSML